MNDTTFFSVFSSDLSCFATNKILNMLFDICVRFINREGIDFSDAQNMQAVQVLCHLGCCLAVAKLSTLTYWK